MKLGRTLGILVMVTAGWLAAPTSESIHFVARMRPEYALADPATGRGGVAGTNAAATATAGRTAMSRARRSGRPSALLSALAPVIIAAAHEYQLDPALLAAVIHTESGFNAGATSPKGAMGLMQLMPDTASRLGVAAPYNPAQNVFGGAKYLRQMMDRFGGNPVLALAAYNAGPGAVEKFGGVPPFAETRNYIPRVARNYQRYRR